MSVGTASLCYNFLFFSVVVFVSAEQKNITAESGQNVTLTCRAPNNNITAVHWSRTDLRDKYILLYQDGHLVTDDQHPSFKNRVDLQDRQMKDGDVSLILKDVTINDAARYKCHVLVNGTDSWKLVSIINLRVSPEQKNITAESGQDVTLTCRAPNNNIKFVHWSKAYLTSGYVYLYQEGQFVPQGQHPSFKNRVDLQDRQMKDGDVSLILNNVTINDTGTYECRVFMEETRSRELIIIIYLTVVVPPEQKIITAQSGQNVTLICRAPNNNITAVHWSRTDLTDKYVLLYQDGQFDPEDQHPSFKNRVDLQDRQMKDGDVSLILKDVNTADSGTYECRVFIEETRSWKNSIILHLIVPPDPKIITAESGQDVTLTCRAPNNNIVKWSKADLVPQYVILYQDGHFISANQHPSFKNRVDLQDRQMKDGDVSLILKDVNTADSGTYECRVVSGTKHRSRDISTEPISIIHLHVVPPGQTGGQEKDEDNKDGGKTNGVKKEDLPVVLMCFLLLLLLLS
ncbi:neural cell adhesion molecule 2-like isoform X2 [Simochromis diagramma]|uniref:neural cell adhesion molecule 2-like isoform X2 n=1 Tax=Simochromis diagramma TaxID=43689 RepID=UPI001A7EA113|nr:neural cell adhesion molecule 2-like isoform X2 [Simochromis diagramma]